MMMRSILILISTSLLLFECSHGFMFPFNDSFLVVNPLRYVAGACNKFLNSNPQNRGLFANMTAQFGNLPADIHHNFLNFYLLNSVVTSCSSNCCESGNYSFKTVQKTLSDYL